MSAADRLQAAINKLERLRTESEGLGPLRGSLAPVAEELILTLHRTIDAQLDILRSALGDAGGSHDEPGAFDLGLALADAILGVDS